MRRIKRFSSAEGASSAGGKPPMGALQTCTVSRKAGLSGPPCLPAIADFHSRGIDNLDAAHKWSTRL
jgi:hypothetical protein